MNTIKAGDTLDASLRLYDEFKKEPIVIDESVQFHATVKDLYGKILSVPIISLYDQVAQSGWIRIIVPSTDTIQWQPGRGNLEIKIVVDGNVIISTKTIQFLIISPISRIGESV